MAGAAEVQDARKYDDIVYEIYDYLNAHHIGETNAIPAKMLANKFHISDRALREAINVMRNAAEFESIIGSSMGGYYICRKDEFETMNKRLMRAAFSLLKVAYSNEKKAARDGQGKLTCNEEVQEFVKSFANNQ